MWLLGIKSRRGIKIDPSAVELPCSCFVLLWSLFARRSSTCTSISLARRTILLNDTPGPALDARHRTRCLLSVETVYPDTPRISLRTSLSDTCSPWKFLHMYPPHFSGIWVSISISESVHRSHHAKARFHAHPRSPRIVHGSRIHLTSRIPHPYPHPPPYLRRPDPNTKRKRPIRMREANNATAGASNLGP